MFDGEAIFRCLYYFVIKCRYDVVNKTADAYSIVAHTVAQPYFIQW